MNKVKKIILSLAIVVVLVLICAICITFARSKVEHDSNPIVTMEIENYGTIKIELYPDMAPNTVKNFVALINNGFYNGKTISEIDSSRIVGGYDLTAEDSKDTEKESDKKSDKKKESKKKAEVKEDSEEEKEVKPGPMASAVRQLKEGEEDDNYSIAGEFVEAGYTDNKLSHQRGVLSMDRETYETYETEMYMTQLMGYGSYTDSLLKLLDNSANSGFFIMTKNDISFDGQYAAFGKVIEGMDVVDKISEAELVKASKDDKEKNTKTPKKDIKIKSISVDTKGIKYDSPETSGRIDFSTLFGSILQQGQGAK